MTMYEGDTEQWRQNDPERRFYRRRNVISEAVENIADKRGIPTNEAAAALDVWRLRQANTSLNNLLSPFTASKWRSWMVSEVRKGLPRSRTQKKNKKEDQSLRSVIMRPASRGMQYYGWEAEKVVSLSLMKRIWGG